MTTEKTMITVRRLNWVCREDSSTCLFIAGLCSKHNQTQMLLSPIHQSHHRFHNVLGFDGLQRAVAGLQFHFAFGQRVIVV
jgi:hypothetical protein